MHFTLYIRPSCPYSQEAISIIKRKKHTSTVVNVDDYNGISSVVSDLKKSKCIPRTVTHKTVPIVFDQNGKFIGGYTELAKYIAE